MATLTVTNTYLAGTLAKASEVNQNFTDIVNWSAGNIQNDNIGTLSGPVTWAITTGVQAISISNAGSEGSVTITQSSPLSSNKAIMLIDDNASTSASSLAFDVQSEARGVRFSAMTTTNRDGITSPVTGSLIYNTTDNQYQYYDGERWSTTNGTTGDIIMHSSSTIPPGWLECDFSEISRTTYAKLFARIGITYGSGDGSLTFNVPDFRGRAPVGVGTGSGLTTRALTTQFGGEAATMPAHTHAPGSHTHTFSATSANEVGDHHHKMFTDEVLGAGAGSVTIADPVSRALSAASSAYPTAIENYTMVAGTIGITHGRTSGVISGAHTHVVSGTTGTPSASNTGGTTPAPSGDNMQPSLGVKFLIKA